MPRSVRPPETVIPLTELPGKKNPRYQAGLHVSKEEQAKAFFHGHLASSESTRLGLSTRFPPSGPPKASTEVPPAMATAATSVESSANPGKTAAQLLQEQHEAAANHKPTVEDVVDEDDVQHPPPPHSAPKDEPDPASEPMPTNGMMSAKASGKQKATEKLGVLDMNDEAAFPALGSLSSSSNAPVARALGWSASAAVKAPQQNGLAADSRPSSSGLQTPNSTPGVRTPTSTMPTMPTTRSGGSFIPGRKRDNFTIEAADLDKSKSIPQVKQEVKRLFKVDLTTKELVNSQGKTAIQFIAEGPERMVTEALLHVSKEITTEKKVTFEIPSVVSSQVIGKAGANIRKLESQFGVRIKIHRNKSDAASDAGFSLDKAEITGHAAQVRQVEAHIRNQVKALQPRADVRLNTIPPEFYTFLAGRHAPQVKKLEQDHDLQIQIPQFHMWQQQPPPRASEDGQSPLFVPHGDSHIIVSGDQQAAMQGRQELERLAEQLQQELMLEELACEQILHPYIVGERGMDPLEFLEQTGCAIILPPDHLDTEDIHIIGPADKLSQGRDLAEKLMTSKHNRAVDLNKHYADAPHGPERHSRALAQYLKQKAIEREFMNTHNAEVVFPQGLSASPTWNIIADDAQKAMSARNELSKITQAYPTPRLSTVDIDPFFHPHLEELHAQQLRDDFGVHILIPEDENEPVVLVYEGPQSRSPFAIPRTKPTKAEISQFEKALQQAQEQLLNSIPQQNISAHELNAPRKHHDRVRRFVNNEPSQQPFPIQVNFGQRGDDRVFLKGPSEDDVEQLRKKIEQFLIDLEQEDKERSYTTILDFPEKFNKNLIGRNGQFISELRAKHDVNIDLKEINKVAIQGPPKKAEACRAEIAKLLKQWQDEVNYVIKVDPKYHGLLVGKNGENLQKLGEKTNNLVRIDFPRQPRFSDDQSVSSSPSRLGGQPADEIKIRGPKAKADLVKDELLSLKQWYEDTTQIGSVTVARAQLPALIGRGGQALDRLRQDTGAEIRVPKTAEGERVTIELTGTKEQVAAAKAEIQRRSKDFDSIVSRTVEVDRKWHGDLIGRQGSNIREIASRAGVTGDSSSVVRFPQRGETSDKITITEKKDVVDRICADIEQFVKNKQDQATETIDVPVNMHRSLIGSMGATKRKLESDYGVKIFIPDRNSGSTDVEITGPKANIAKAKSHIATITAQQKTETVMIPRKLHHIVARDGNTFGELSRMNIRIDHGGQKPPEKPQSAVPPPLITDASSHTFEIVTHDSGETGEIPWIITPGQNARDGAAGTAKEKIEKLLAQAGDGHVTGYLTLPDPKLHRHVIGPRGETINRIRDASGCDVQVPKNKGKGAVGEAIVIVGPEEGVLKTKDMILEEVEERP